MWSTKGYTCQRLFLMILQFSHTMVGVQMKVSQNCISKYMKNTYRKIMSEYLFFIIIDEPTHAL
jgi:hypothetical protein